MKSLTPLLHIQDLAESLVFYQALGFETEQRLPEEGTQAGPFWSMGEYI
jgi:predicted lactoylglutathione lyase